MSLLFYIFSIYHFDEYDVIFVSYSIWWSVMLHILYTFVETYDL